jgi:hypothetical protein
MVQKGSATPRGANVRKRIYIYTPRKHKALPNEFLDISNSNNKIKDPFEIANTFNNYFVNIGPNLAKGINHTSNCNCNFNKYLTNSYLNSMFLDPTTNFEVENEIQKLKLNKSPGYDGLRAKVIKL